MEKEGANLGSPKEANISLILEDYNDIFSDFDPRTYSEKAISNDFLAECKRAVRDKPNKEFELKLLMPESKRNVAHELKIKRRLKDHFQKHVIEKQSEVFGIVKRGLILAVIGAVLMISAAYITYIKFLPGNFLSIAMLIILEPAGWFFFWEGMAKAIFLDEDEKKKKREFEFYKKMAHAQIYFANY